MTKLRVAMIAPPWLALPVKGYGGIELVIESLVYGLKKQGVEVEVFGNGAHKLRGVKTHSLYKSDQFPNIHRPYYETYPLLQAHMEFALNKIREDGHFDIIHDHNPLIGPSFFAYATLDKKTPPALHTLHGPPFSSKETLDQGIPDNRPQLEQLHDMNRMYMVAISDAMAKTAPKSIKDHLLTAVHNAIRLDRFPVDQHKRDYYITLARFTPDKGQHVAVKYAIKFNKRLRMAGMVAGIGSSRRLLLELANPLSSYRNNKEFRYYSDKIFPQLLLHRRISYTGNLSGVRKMQFLSRAKALLFPIDWEEPFGMAVIEALACGTPVVAMNRGAMPEIIDHGVNGFLANNEKEFADYMLRVNEIDPKACRESVERKFSAETMASNYIDRYQEVIRRSR